MLEGYAEYYSAELSEKVIRGLTDNALKCKYNGGTVPMGYYIDEQQYYQIDPKTAPVVLEMFTKYSEGATMQELVNLLNSRGYAFHSWRENHAEYYEPPFEKPPLYGRVQLS